MISRFFDSLSDEPRCTSPINRHPDGWAKGFRDSRPLWMPVTVEWDKPCKVRLYNLKNDPSENRNIAFEQREKVKEIVDVLNERLKVEEGRMDLMSGLQYGIYQAFVNIAIGVVSVLLCLIIVMVLGCCKCCGCGLWKRKRSKRKTD